MKQVKAPKMNTKLLQWSLGCFFIATMTICAQDSRIQENGRVIQMGVDLEEMTQLLNLSEKQQKQISDVLNDLSSKAKSNQMKDIKISNGNTLEDRLQKILTQEQFKKYYQKTRQGMM